MLGSVFSPHYAKATARGAGDPLAHAAVNVALYDMERPSRGLLSPLGFLAAGDGAWALSEGARVCRSADALRVGRSTVWHERDTLKMEIDEQRVPFPSPLRGTISVALRALCDTEHTLDRAGKHVWRPIAPLCRVHVRFTEPDLTFRGTGYVDANAGDEPLGRAFSGWTWSRLSGRGETRVVYDLAHRDGARTQIAQAFGCAGERAMDGPIEALPLPRTRWRIPRTAHVPRGARVGVGATLEDTPFYARTHLTGALAGASFDGVHEVLDLDRFAAPWVQFLLPFRTRRHAP